MEFSNFNDLNFYRYDLLNFIIKKYKFDTYLEIGCASGVCYDKIICKNKKCVDPVSHPYMKNKLSYNMKSDDFFNINKDTFDLIFIDGLHESNQVIKDVKKSLQILNDDGIILLHDCLPTQEIHQKPTRESAHWNGDVWKAVAEYRRDPNLFIMTVNTDEGLGFIKKGKQIPFNITENLDFNFYKKNWQSLMNVVSVNEALNIINNSLY